MEAVRRAYEVARRCPGSLVLLAAEPDSAEVEYGWIETRPRLRDDATHGLYRVSRFYEKPSRQAAERMLARGGCLWNTFVMFGHVGTFLDVLNNTVPNTLRWFNPVAECQRSDAEKVQIDRIYKELPTGDFSAQVLSKCTARLIALRAPGLGWTDMGNHERVAVLMRQGFPQGAGMESNAGESQNAQDGTSASPELSKKLAKTYIRRSAVYDL